MPVFRKKAANKASKKAKATTPKKAPKNVDAMIDEKPAHSTNEMREYLRRLLKGGK